MGVAFAALIWISVVMSAVPRANAVHGGRQSQSAPPSFRAPVELVTIDLQIVPAKDATLREFLPKDFTVRVSGRDRTAVSATRMHEDTGAVTRDVPRTPPPECVFDFRRQVDRPTVHYVLAFDLTEPDRKEISRVAVHLTDKAFSIQRYVWRSPIRK